MKALLASAYLGGGKKTYDIPYSLNFDGSSKYLSRTVGSASGMTTWKVVVRLRRWALGSIQTLFHAGADANNYFHVYFDANDKLAVAAASGGSIVWNLLTTQRFRDVLAHGTLEVEYDSTQATAANRVKLYWNGQQITAFDSAVYPGSGVASYWNGAYTHTIGRGVGGSYYAAIVLSEFYSVSGSVSASAQFGAINPATNSYAAKQYGGTFGSNGFRLRFRDGTSTTTLGYDDSGNGNHFTLNGFSTADQLTDTPTNTYPIFNTLKSQPNIAGAGLQYSLSSNGGPFGSWTSIGVSQGAWYFEYKVTSETLAGNDPVGIGAVSLPLGRYAGQDGGSYGYSTDGYKRNNGTSAAYGSAATAGDTIMVAFNLNTGKIWWGKNGTWFGSGDPATDSNPAYSGIAASTYAPLASRVSTGVSYTTIYDFNFGQKAFTYTPPSGFKALCTKNLPTPTIKLPRQHFDVVTRTGTGALATISGKAFAPDFIWAKSRNSARDHYIADSVRGVNKALVSNTTYAEYTSTNGLLTFNADGYSLGSSAGDSEAINLASDTYVDWLWKAGGAAASNTDGSITSQVSANTTAGFSIVKWSGTGASGTVGHGLGKTPKLIIARDINGVANWSVYHVNANASPASGRMQLNLTDAFTAASTIWNNTVPDSATFSVGTGLSASGRDLIGYCFDEIPGYSKIFSYSPNNSVDGPYIDLGFKARWLLLKGTGGASGWYIYDTVRQTYNPLTLDLRADLSNAEPVSSQPIDVLSGGIKIRTTDINFNDSSYGPYVGIAIAEVPYQFANAA